MAEKFISERNLKFLLYEAFDAEQLLKYPMFADHSREEFDMVLDTAMKMGKDLFKPILKEMDQCQPEYVDGTVKVHPQVRTIMKECGEGGWIGASFPYEWGGQQLPMTFGVMVPTAIWSAANYSGSVFSGLSTGASALIASFCDVETRNMYVPKMMSGEWQGTMALTEPQAGSSLSDITLTGIPTDDGYYMMKGQKIFISAGDHDGVDNVIHLAIGRIKGAPAGIKGVSLFIIPQKRIEANGDLTPNDVNCAGIYHKLGYRGAPITQLAFGESDDCRGWLIGEPGKGITYMFKMMNGARIDVGLGAACIASAAYYASVEYARERTQGREITSKDPMSSQIPIIEHADVKRMLLFQKAIVEGSLSLLTQCSIFEDLANVTEGEEQEKNHLLLELLTPVCKTYPAEMGILSCSAGIQVLGGYGFCDEFPLEQFYRDVRIHTLHEGTTGIQGMDLLGRKMTMKQGKAVKLYFEELLKAIKNAEVHEELKAYGQALKEALGTLEKTMTPLMGLAMEGKIALFLADAAVFLELFGIITIAWQWLVQATVAKKALANNPIPADADFYQGKLHTCAYFFNYELSKVDGLSKSVLGSNGLTLAAKAEHFNE